MHGWIRWLGKETILEIGLNDVSTAETWNTFSIAMYVRLAETV
jgi:hypothetical protein